MIDSKGKEYVFDVTDGGAPDIYMVEGERRTYRQGDEISLPKAYASDVLDNELSYFTVTVSGPDGQPIAATDGTVLNYAPIRDEYRIKLDKTGSYTLIYAAADGSGNVDPYTYTVRVRDAEPPEITISSASIPDAKLGDTVAVPTATVTGGTTDGKVYVYVINPHGLVRKHRAIRGVRRLRQYGG